MKHVSVAPPQRGFVLLPVMMVALLLAALVALMRLDTAGATRSLSANAESARIDYVLEAAFADASERAQRASCTAYGLPETAFGEERYAATFAPTAGSPVQVNAIATLGNGNTRAATREGVQVFAPEVHELVLQPGPEAGADTQISSNQPTRNYGSAAQLVIQKTSGQRMLLAFDLGAVPVGVRIESATLELDVTTDAGNVLALHALSRAWREGTCDGTAACNANGATWNTTDGVTGWTQAGGDYGAEAATALTIAAPGGRIVWEVGALIAEWYAGTRPNYGFVLIGSGSPQTTVTSSDDPLATARPLLRIRYRCECGVACAAAVPPVCDANFAANQELDRVSGATLGAKTPAAVEYLPAGSAYAGVVIPDGGGWLLADSATATLTVSDSSGVVLARHALAAGDPRGVARVGNGVLAGQVAVSHGASQRVFLHRSDGSVATSFSTSAFSARSYDLAYVDSGAGGTYDGLLALASDRDASGRTVAAIHLLGLDGSLRATLDVSSVLSSPQGVAHLPGSDRLLVTSSLGEAVVIDLQGRVLHRYAANALGVTLPAAGAIDTQRCAHVLTDSQGGTVYLLVRGGYTPLAHWRFDEGSGVLASDSVGTHDGKINGPNWTTGRDGNALQFDGSGRVEVPHASGLVLRDAFSIALWFQTAGVDGALIAKGSSASDTNFHLALSAGRIEFVLGGATLQRLRTGNVNLKTGQWYHLVATYSNAADQVSLYLDGVAVLAATTTRRAPGSTRDLVIGRSELEGKEWTGLIDDVRLYDQVLDAEGVADMYAGFPALPGTVTGGTTTPAGQTGAAQSVVK